MTGTGTNQGTLFSFVKAGPVFRRDIIDETLSDICYIYLKLLNVFSYSVKI